MKEVYMDHLISMLMNLFTISKVIPSSGQRRTSTAWTPHHSQLAMLPMFTGHNSILGPAPLSLVTLRRHRRLEELATAHQQVKAPPPLTRPITIQAHPFLNLHTPSTSISTSTGTGASTVESTASGPSTPLHAYGSSPALSSRNSFDIGHGRPHQSGMGLPPLPKGIDKRHGEAGGQKEPGPEAFDAVPPAPHQHHEGQYVGAHVPPERNSVDVGRIEAGLDTRTTVMLKNVPNKMSDSDLRKYISDVVPNAFDFVYLRFDFNSSANVGYAFVNFVDVADLLTFAKAKLGVKWNMFCSEKVLQMSYANFQGKEALVEKFKNSCVMEMQDEWVPKIFYSSGPNKGQREPFPPATNPSRARRSQDQRERGLIRGSGLYVGGGRGHFGFKHGQ